MKPKFLVLLLIIFSSCGEKKFIPEHGMKKIKDSSQSMELTIGQKAYYQTREHRSTGKRVKMISENEDIVRIIKIQEDHDNLNWENEDGGDVATKTFILDAKQAGKTSIKIIYFEGGEIENEQTMNFTIQ